MLLKGWRRAANAPSPSSNGATFSMWDHESPDQKAVGERRGDEKKIENREEVVVAGNLAETGG